MAAIPTLEEIMVICCNEGSTIPYLINTGALAVNDVGVECGSDMSRKGQTQLRCKRFSCRKTKFLFSLTVFKSRSYNCHKILLLAYLWISRGNFYIMQIQTGLANFTSSKWIKIFERVNELNLESEDNMTEGEGIIMEIDELSGPSAGRYYIIYLQLLSLGIWIVRGAERTRERRLFATVTQSRNAPTLYTDCWRGYIYTDMLFDYCLKSGYSK
jgi:hypothetical protein